MDNAGTIASLVQQTHAITKMSSNKNRLTSGRALQHYVAFSSYSSVSNKNTTNSIGSKR